MPTETPHMDWFDIIVILILGYFGYAGYMYGLIAGVLELLGIVLSVAIPFILYSPFGHLLGWMGVSTVYAGAVAFLIIWLITLVGYFITVRRLYNRVPKEDRVTAWNLSLGILTGLIRGTVVVAIILFVLTILPLSPGMQSGIEHSALSTPILAVTTAVNAKAAGIFGEAEQSLGFLTLEPKTDETVPLRFNAQNPLVDSSAEDSMLELVNQERKSRGLEPLVMDSALRDVAREHSVDMLKRGYFGHNTLEGVSPSDRLKKGGVDFSAAGENIAFSPSVDVAHSGLMRSPGHRENILRPQFGRIGIGAERCGRGIMFTQDFAN
jgi:uncharacterized protein YkwD